MKRVLFLLVALSLAGCGPSTPDIADNATELAKLPQWTQLALVMRTPLIVIAWAIVANGGISLFTIKTTARKKEKDGAS